MGWLGGLACSSGTVRASFEARVRARVRVRVRARVRASFKARVRARVRARATRARARARARAMASMWVGVIIGKGFWAINKRFVRNVPGESHARDVSALPGQQVHEGPHTSRRHQAACLIQ